jgi:hypothetical protein
MQDQRCYFCGHIVSLVHVHGHYQCPACNTNALPCCDGDNCDTNLLPGGAETKSAGIIAELPKGREWNRGCNQQDPDSY